MGLALALSLYSPYCCMHTTGKLPLPEAQLKAGTNGTELSAGKRDA